MKMGIGVGTMVLKNSQVLLGRRHEDPEKADSELHGEGTWTMPGGKVEFNEELEDACCRETFEEAGLTIKKENLKFISLSNDYNEIAHFLTAGFLCEKFEGEPRVMEPDEITEWQWFDLDKLPDKVFTPSQKVLDNYFAGKIYRPL